MYEYVPRVRIRMKKSMLEIPAQHESEEGTSYGFAVSVLEICRIGIPDVRPWREALYHYVLRRV
ncbi:hypothetical protein SHO565_74420 [Streptomyces sp. HO565]